MRIAIIGGGPAGFFGAISAATHNRSATITIFEGSKTVLSKVLISGGGRCNVTYHCYEPSELVKYYPRGGKELRGSFSRFQPRDTVAWFRKQGVQLKTEEDGRIFPVTDKSSTIADCLISAAKSLAVKIQTGVRIRKISMIPEISGLPGFEIESGSGRRESFDRVLLAAGGGFSGMELARMLGHDIIRGVPSLFAFKVIDPRLRGLSGLSFKNVNLILDIEKVKRWKESGAILITHGGLSGPAVLKLSSWGARALAESGYRGDLTINYLPDYTIEGLRNRFLSFKEKHGRRLVRGENNLPVPRRFWERIVHVAGVDDKAIWADLRRMAINTIVSELCGGRYAICGKGPYKDEFVTCGGINLKEVDFRTMQSRKCPGLYLAGEILDIDGLTGGFNFQNAWTTGWIAGISIAK